MAATTFDAIHESIVARGELILAALRVLSAERRDGAERGSADELDYAEDQLALAARQLVNATDALPADQRPVGWTS